MTSELVHSCRLRCLRGRPGDSSAWLVAAVIAALAGCGQGTTDVSQASSGTDSGTNDSAAALDASTASGDAGSTPPMDVQTPVVDAAADTELPDTNADVVETPPNWLISHDPSDLVVEGNEVHWTPKKPHTILLNLPEDHPLDSAGDVVEFRYLFLSDGDANMPGCTTFDGSVCRDNCSECPMEGSTHPCHQIGCDHDDDIACLAGTGDFRVGVFDSNGRGKVADHGFGEKNDLFAGYLGYQWRFHPHICDVKRYTELKSDCDTESHTNVTAWKRAEPAIDPCSEELLGDCDPRPWSRIFDPVAACFDLTPNTFGELLLRLERLDDDRIRIQFKFNGVGTFEVVDDDDSNQPSKIDVLAIHFSNARPYRIVQLKKL
jgi:hypothetical protein